MDGLTVARFGMWPSTVIPELVSGATLAFSELAVDGDTVNWLELRPAERGRRALVRWSPGSAPQDALPSDADVGDRGP